MDEAERRQKNRQALDTWRAAHPDGKTTDAEKQALQDDLKAWMATVQRAVDEAKRRPAKTTQNTDAKAPVDVIFLNNPKNRRRAT